MDARCTPSLRRSCSSEYTVSCVSSTLNSSKSSRLLPDAASRPSIPISDSPTTNSSHCGRLRTMHSHVRSSPLLRSGLWKTASANSNFQWKAVWNPNPSCSSRGIQLHAAYSHFHLNLLLQEGEQILVGAWGSAVYPIHLYNACRQSGRSTSINSTRRWKSHRCTPVGGRTTA